MKIKSIFTEDAKKEIIKITLLTVAQKEIKTPFIEQLNDYLQSLNEWFECLQDFRKKGESYELTREEQEKYDNLTLKRNTTRDILSNALRITN